MSISPYVRSLREKVGRARLLLPSVTAAVHDEAGDLLLVRQRDGGFWSTPGGVIEPDETPADAVVRETWEETGLLIAPTRILAVWGGPGFLVRYPNGDESQYVMTVFDCHITGGDRRPDGVETVDVRFWSLVDATALPLAGWLQPVLQLLFGDGGEAEFEMPRWLPHRATPDKL